MSRCAQFRRSLRWVSLAMLLVGPLAVRASDCTFGPLPATPGCPGSPDNPGNPDNHLGMCSPTPDDVQVRILPNGLELTWDAPPRDSTAYVGPVRAARWIGLDSLAVVPTVRLRGAYMSFKDRRIELSVQSIDSIGTRPVAQGLIGRDRVRIAWTSLYEASATGAVAGLFQLPVGYAGEPLRFEMPNRNNPQLPPDTTVVGGVRVTFRPGDTVRAQDSAVFDVEDFEGWHVWRWGGDPCACDYQAVGEYSKLRATASPAASWPDMTPGARRVTFVDRNVFDGFLYYYAITSFDQGFRRSTSGTDMALKFESPIEPATCDSVGQLLHLGRTQIRVDFRQPPPTTFTPIAAVPNPYRASEVDPSRAETCKIFFINAPPRGTLYIWTVAGDLVYQGDHTLPAVGTLEFEMCRAGTKGEKLASGVYIYKIVDLVSGRQSFGRLVVIR